MATAIVPTPPDWSGGGTTTTTQLNQLTACLNFIMNVPAFRGRQTSAQTLTSSVWASILLDLEDLDSDPSGTGGAHSTSTLTSRFTAVYAGWYFCSGGVGWSSMATPAGRRGVRWAVNGSAIRASANHFQPGTSTLAGSYGAQGVLVFLGISDYIEIQGFYEGGGTLALNVGDERESGVSLFWVRNA